jgi:hypothetical protein
MTNKQRWWLTGSASLLVTALSSSHAYAINSATCSITPQTPIDSDVSDVLSGGFGVFLRLKVAWTLSYNGVWVDDNITSVTAGTPYRVTFTMACTDLFGSTTVQTLQNGSVVYSTVNDGDKLFNLCPFGSSFTNASSVVTIGP